MKPDILSSVFCPLYSVFCIPNALARFDLELSAKQKRILEMLPKYNSRVTVNRNAVSMVDLSALTCVTGDEFAMFTKGKERLVIRGNSRSVSISEDEAKKLSDEGYRWSGHTHPGVDEFVLFSSEGDRIILACFKHEKSVIYNSVGKYSQFRKEI
jgi:hypothetical protein